MEQVKHKVSKSGNLYAVFLPKGYIRAGLTVMVSNADGKYFLGKVAKSAEKRLVTVPVAYRQWFPHRADVLVSLTLDKRKQTEKTTKFRSGKQPKRAKHEEEKK